MKRLSTLVLGSQGNNFFDFDGFLFFGFIQPPPADARALARKHLKTIDDRIALALGGSSYELDAYSRAHLEQLHDQIGKVLTAPLKMNEL